MKSAPNSTPNGVKNIPVPRHEQFVYLMRNMRNGYTKIGVSKQPSFREKTLQSEEPEIEMICAYRCCSAVESDLHQINERKRIRGEWFDLTDFDILCCQSYIVGIAAEDDYSLDSLDIFLSNCIDYLRDNRQSFGTVN